MSCNQGQTTTSCQGTSGSGYVIIIVLYILLAIILGAWLAS